MSVDLLLEADGLTDVAVTRLVEFSAGPGTWPLHGQTSGSSRRGFLAGQHRVDATLGLAERDDDGVTLFANGGQADGDGAWVVAAGSRARFRATLHLLSEELPGGFSFRVRAPAGVPHEVEVLSAIDLADLAESGGLVGETQYVVRPRFT